GDERARRAARFVVARDVASALRAGSGRERRGVAARRSRRSPRFVRSGRASRQLEPARRLRNGRSRRDAARHRGSLLGSLFRAPDGGGGGGEGEGFDRALSVGGSRARPGRASGIQLTLFEAPPYPRPVAIVPGDPPVLVPEIRPWPCALRR